MFNLDTDTSEEDELFRRFGDRYIDDALRVVSSKHSFPNDQEMIYEAMCIIVALYLRKVQDGKIDRRTVH